MRNFKLFVCFLLFNLSCTIDKPDSESQEIIGSIDGQNIYTHTIDGLIQEQLYESLYGIYYKRRIALRQYVKEELLNKESRKLNISKDSLLHSEIDAKINKEGLDKYIKDHYLHLGIPDRNNPTRSIDINSQEGQQVVNEAYKEKLTEDYILHLMDKYNVKINLAPPLVPKSDFSKIQGHQRGNINSKLKVWIITDFDCTVCQSNSLLFENLFDKYKDKVSFYYSNFAQEISFPVFLCECANSQNKFWEIREVLFKNPAKDTSFYLTEAEKLNLDMNLINECTSSNKMHNQILANFKKIANEGILHTPALVIDDRIYYGELSLGKISEVIDQALN